ncbi:MAG TPA: YcxB family protein [Thermoanaerobaculia bacterium]|nr:YcxB family protein [Thermoanaerobaculia bacterium]
MSTADDPNEIPFSGQLTEAEFRQIVIAGFPRLFRFWPWLYLSAIVMVLLTADLHEFVAHPLQNFPGTLFLLALAVFLLVVPRRAARKAWQTNVAIREPFSGSLSSTGLSWQGAFAQGKYPWDALYGYRSRAKILLVYSGMNQALFLLPRFFASPAEWEAAEELISKNLRPR